MDKIYIIIAETSNPSDLEDYNEVVLGFVLTKEEGIKWVKDNWNRLIHLNENFEYLGLTQHEFNDSFIFAQERKVLWQIVFKELENINNLN